MMQKPSIHCTIESWLYEMGSLCEPVHIHAATLFYLAQEPQKSPLLRTFAYVYLRFVFQPDL